MEGSLALGSSAAYGLVGSAASIAVTGGIIAGTLWLLDMIPGQPSPLR